MTAEVLSPEPSGNAGWRFPRKSPTLPEVYRSIPIPPGASVVRKMLAFAGPGYMVAVGYMDPGNWATDLAGGARFGYTLLSAHPALRSDGDPAPGAHGEARPGHGKGFAQACRDHYSPSVSFVPLGSLRDCHCRV